MMPTAEVRQLGPGLVRIQLCDPAPLTVSDVLQNLEEGRAVAALSGAILDTGFDAVLWECPPWTTDRLGDDFECVVNNSPALSRMHLNPAPFQAYLEGQQHVVAFDNLGGDARLVAPPCDGRDYTHLSAFLRHAPHDLRQQFWAMVARETQSKMGQEPLWLSTSGLGVGWLHARIDSEPKYYSYAAYTAVS